jgi:hypothetical protein
MPKPTIKNTRTIRSEQVLKAFVQVVRWDLPLDLKNTRITADDIISFSLALSFFGKVRFLKSARFLWSKCWRVGISLVGYANFVGEGSDS